MMADDQHHNDGASRSGRTWDAPMRAITRVLRAGDAPEPAAPTAGRPSQWLIDCAVYVNGHRQPGRPAYTEALAAARRDGGFVWLGLHEPTEAAFAEVAATFGLHEVAVEQAVSAGHRPKIERYGDATLVVLRTTRYVEHSELTETSEVVETGDVLAFVGDHFVITVRHGAPGALGAVRADLEQRPDLLSLGPWAVAYMVCDRLIDTYEDVAAAVETDIDEVEEQVFGRSSRGGIADIYQLKRELVEFKRAVAPLQRPMTALIEDKDLLPKEIRRYFRDVNDHLQRTVDRVSAFDDLLHSILQARLAQVTVDQNNDMRKIAAWAAIAAVQTTIAGIYGMNFTHMPELQWRYGYPALLTVMLVAGVTTYRMLRRSGWL